MLDSVQLQPKDQYNLELERNVHPPDWVNPEPANRYNLVVIGAGTAGLVTAAGAAGLGAKVALIERELMGGDCLNVGCVPSKALLASGHAAAALRDAAHHKVLIEGGYTVDFAGVMERMRRLRAGISHHDSAKRFKDLGIDVFLGEGRFSSSSTVEVDGRTLNFRKAVIATGARAAAPPIAGLDQVEYLTNETIFSLTELPKRLGIIGAGPVGCEMAQAFARFGSQVTLIEAQDRILPNDDLEASELVKSALKRDGINVLCCGKNVELSKRDGQIHIAMSAEDKSYDLTVDRLLIGVGRAANVDTLDLEKAGVEYTKHGITVSDKLQSSNPKIYAAGDVCSKFKFTHAADFMARIVIQNALFFGRAKLSAMTIPWCTYTDPELAHVGMSEKELRDSAIEVATYTQSFDAVDRAILEGNTEGFVRIHTKKGSDKILGATIVGAHAGDMISQISMAMTNGLGLKKIASTISPYPTRAEAIRKVGDQYSRTRLTPLVKSLFSLWLKWAR